MKEMTPLDALARYGSYRKAAAALGIAASTFQNRVDVARAQQPAAITRAEELPIDGFAVVGHNAKFNRNGELTSQSVQTRRAPGPEYVVPEGLAVKEESALTDGTGRLMLKWTKAREGAAVGLVEALTRHFAAYTGTAPAIPAPPVSDDDLITVYPLPDLHFGMYAWGAETGEDYDTDIATGIAERNIGALVAQSRPSRHAVILGLGDYFHANDLKGQTPGSGHGLDVDTRWPRVFAAGARLATALVSLVAQRHESVEVVFLPGNHDPDAAIALTVALALFYSGNPRIAVHQEPGIAWFRRFGRVLLAATHGHTMKPDRFAHMVAADRAVDWGASDHRHGFMGHIHHETAKELGGIRIESFQSPAAKDAYNAGHGYRAGRSLSALTFHVTRGEIGRHRVNIPKPTSTRDPHVSLTDTRRSA